MEKLTKELLLRDLGLPLTTKRIWSHFTTIHKEEIEELWEQCHNDYEVQIHFSDTPKRTVDVSLSANIFAVYMKNEKDMDYSSISVEVWHQDGITSIAIEYSEIEMIQKVFEYFELHPILWKVVK